MSLFSKRLVTVAASTLVLSLVSASAHAQTDVFNTGYNGANRYGGSMISTYQFTSDMTLNSIAFLSFSDRNQVADVFSYEIGNSGYVTVSNPLGNTANEFQWIDLGSGLTIKSGTTLKVKTEGFGAAWVSTGAQNAGTNVNYLSLDSSVMGSQGSGLTNSNLRVSPANPGSNVAPEPGSFALALTGGAALLGICVRRRRNAG